jgi:hypothetical protein
MAHPDREFRVLPMTRAGWWAVGLGLAGLLLLLVWTVLPGGGAIGLALELAGGIVALVAFTRHGERALLAFFALFPFLMAVVFVVAELVEIIRAFAF